MSIRVLLADDETMIRAGLRMILEAEVLHLLAHGLSNAEIAGTLRLGDATVKTHVARVLMKLSLRDRVQAVIYAYEHDLVRPRHPGSAAGPPRPARR